MRVDKVLEKLAKADNVMVSLEALPDGKIRANTSAWGDAKVLLRTEVLEVRVITGSFDWRAKSVPRRRRPADRAV
jgi:hypothetical protein